jgi:hypothetical protein
MDQAKGGADTTQQKCLSIVSSKAWTHGEEGKPALTRGPPSSGLVPRFFPIVTPCPMLNPSSSSALSRLPENKPLFPGSLPENKLEDFQKITSSLSYYREQYLENKAIFYWVFFTG